MPTHLFLDGGKASPPQCQGAWQQALVALGGGEVDRRSQGGSPRDLRAHGGVLRRSARQCPGTSLQGCSQQCGGRRDGSASKMDLIRAATSRICRLPGPADGPSDPSGERPPRRREASFRSCVWLRLHHSTPRRHSGHRARQPHEVRVIRAKSIEHGTKRRPSLGEHPGIPRWIHDPHGHSERSPVARHQLRSNGVVCPPGS